MDLKFDELASDEQIAVTQQALNAHNIQTVVVETGAEARECVLSLIPQGAEVHSAMSTTLDQIGVTKEIEESGWFNALRPQLRKMDRIKQNREWRRMGSAPDVMLGSVHAVTEQGQVLVASGGGSQIGPYASGAGTVIWVVGAQQIVPTLADGLRRIEEHALPLESERMRRMTGRESVVSQILIVQRSLQPNRVKMIIVKENLGF